MVKNFSKQGLDQKSKKPVLLIRLWRIKKKLQLSDTIKSPGVKRAEKYNLTLKYEKISKAIFSIENAFSNSYENVLCKPC
jgi:hypothetical protein